MIVFDSSALIAMLRGETGAQTVRSHLSDSSMSAVGVAEVLTKASDWGFDVADFARKLASLPILYADFTFAHAAAVGRLRDATRHLGLSFSDRACLALAIDRNCPVLTGDRAWAKLNIGVKVELLR